MRGQLPRAMRVETKIVSSRARPKNEPRRGTMMATAAVMETERASPVMKKALREPLSRSAVRPNMRVAPEETPKPKSEAAREAMQTMNAAPPIAKGGTKPDARSQ